MSTLHNRDDRLYAASSKGSTKALAAAANPLGDDRLYAASSKGRIKALATTPNPLGGSYFRHDRASRMLLSSSPP